MAADTQTETPKWAANLTEGERKVVQEIIDQCPTTMGFQSKFVDLLDKIAGKTPPWKYLFVDEDCSVFGSNSDVIAQAAADQDDGTIVISVMDGKVTGIIADEDIEEVENVWVEDDDVTDEPDGVPGNGDKG